MWSIVEINGETAGIAVDNGPYRDRTVDTEEFAEDLETLKLVNGTAGEVVCRNCGERWGVDEDHDEAAAEECPDGEDGATHELSPDHLAWFEEARINVRDAEHEVSVELYVNGKRFRIGVHFAENVDGGSLVLSRPGLNGTKLSTDGMFTVVAD